MTPVPPLLAAPDDAAHGDVLVQAVDPFTADGFVHGYETTLHLALHVLILLINTVGAAIMAWGVLKTVIAFVGSEAKGCPHRVRVLLRERLGYYIVLGLELLIVADIVESMLAPTLEHLAVLAGVALIRTFISFALGYELKEAHKELDREAARRDGDEKEAAT